MRGVVFGEWRLLYAVDEFEKYGNNLYQKEPLQCFPYLVHDGDLAIDMEMINREAPKVGFYYLAKTKLNLIFGRTIKFYKTWLFSNFH